ncbi:hypothetical protein B1987_18020 [Mycobacterium kansasii]|uniref:Uncharacterized protein n=1 Tax=Mycobacterium attenuatum TaxID=2341086 RepID=A0A498PMY1_9MYCO|nr:hypothetical protein [Mycobacterium attenuatum]ORB85374.1 hypothetical protein B1987_18020 [Mycobacterium kansasii]VBA34392.1 hypothetical protein LAUMK136_00679 [Mycobacterium attenuatum]
MLRPYGPRRLVRALLQAPNGAAAAGDRGAGFGAGRGRSAVSSPHEADAAYRPSGNADGDADDSATAGQLHWQPRHSDPDTAP